MVVHLTESGGGKKKARGIASLFQKKSKVFPDGLRKTPPDACIGRTGPRQNQWRWARGGVVVVEGAGKANISVRVTVCICLPEQLTPPEVVTVLRGTFRILPPTPPHYQILMGSHE